MVLSCRVLLLPVYIPAFLPMEENPESVPVCNGIVLLVVSYRPCLLLHR